jgi:hypothetical protein
MRGGGGTVAVLLLLPVLVQFDDVEEDLAAEADLAPLAVGGEEGGGGLQGGQAPAGHPDRVQRRPCVPPPAALHAAHAAAPAAAAALRGHLTPARDGRGREPITTQDSETQGIKAVSHTNVRQLIQ